MGIGDFVPDAVEDVAEKATEKAGDAVEWGGNKTADALDDVGWDSGADFVRDKSRSAANDLGADVAEFRLGESDDPKKLVFGSPSKIRSAMSHLRDLRKAFDKVGNGLKGLDSSHWKGESADAFREKVAVEPKKWFKAADACEKAADALGAYVETLGWAQGQAQDAIDAYNQAKADSKAARASRTTSISDYNGAVRKYNDTLLGGGDPGPLPQPPGAAFTDPGPSGIAAAQGILDEARRQRDEAAGLARKAITAARDAAPPKPSYGDQLGDGMEGLRLDAVHLGGGLLKGGANIVGLARALNPEDPYNVLHPAEYVTRLNSTAAGLLTTVTDPGGTAKQVYDDFSKDPAEGTGRLIPDLLGAKGLGRAEKGVEAASKARRALEREARSPGRKHLDDEPGGRRTEDRKKVCEGDPVDVTTGRMFLSQTDVTLPGELPLTFTRRVESGYAAGRWFGPSWCGTVDQRLEIDSEGVVLIGADGLLLAFPHPAPGVPTLPETGPRRLLERDAHGDYTLTDPDTGRALYFAGPSGAEGPGADGEARLEQISDRGGAWITFAYDAAGTPTAITHSAGYELRLTTAEGRVTALHLGDRELLRYGYTDGDLTEVTNSSGLPLRFEYDDEHRVIAWTDTNNRRYDYVYDNQDRCIAQGGEGGHLSNRFAYSPADESTGHRVTTVTTPEGHTSRYAINSAGQVVAETDPLGNTVRRAYDRHDHVLTHTDALGHTTSYAYDEAGHLTRVTAPDGATSQATYNDLGLPVELTGPDGTTWHQTYDEAGRRTSATDPTGHTTHYAYDDRGHLATVTNALGETTRVRCDRAGLPITITDAAGGTVRYERDAFGRPVAITDQLGARTRLTWSVEGKLTSRTAPDGSQEHWTYDGEGNCTTHTDAIGGVTAYEYTHFDLLAARTGPDGVRYEFTHDASLRLAKVANPQGLTWTYAYDEAGRLAAETDFDDRTLRYAYDAAGRLRSRRSPLGETITYAYDALGRITTKEVGEATTRYAYDPAGRLQQATGPDTEVLYQRDRLGRVKSEMVAGRVLTHTYDPLGRRTRRVTPTGAITTYAYDAAGNRTALTASGRTLESAYDAAGRETRRRIGPSLTLTNTWDPLNRLREQSLAGPAPGEIQHRSYTYREDGHLTAIDDLLSGPRTFDLDTAGRVTTVRARDWTETYAYDEAGNQTQAAWPTDHPAQESVGARTYTGTRIRTAGRIRYEHDEAGRLTLRQKSRLSKKPDTWRYEWDTEDRLKQVTTPDGTVWRYTYDPFGRRVSKERLTADGETALERTDFTWDGPTLVEQTTSSPATPHPVTLTWDHDGLHPLSQTERITDTTTQEEIDARFFAIVTDLVGTPTELVDETGDIAWRTRSTLWGTTTWTSDSTAYTPLRFPGQYFDPETGLHYNVHRYYDPETARYITQDPLGLAPAPNPATYVRNPHAWSDPLGLGPCPQEKPKSGIRKLIDSVFGGGRKSAAEIADEEMRASRIPMKLGDLEDYDLPDLGDPIKVSEIEGMTDERLLEAINDPDILGSYIMLGDDSIAQGNHRIAEALQRMHKPRSNITPDTDIWVIP